jgi:hypothetical protein
MGNCMKMQRHKQLSRKQLDGLKAAWHDSRQGCKQTCLDKTLSGQDWGPKTAECAYTLFEFPCR